MRHPALLLLAAALAAPALADEAPASLTGADLRDEHRARRAALAAALAADAVAVVLADPADPGALIATRANEDYFWLTGTDEPGGILLLAPAPAEPGKPHRERLLLPPRDVRGEVWIGPRLYFGPEAEKSLGVQATGNVREARKSIEEHLAGA